MIFISWSDLKPSKAKGAASNVKRGFAQEFNRFSVSKCPAGKLVVHYRVGSTRIAIADNQNCHVDNKYNRNKRIHQSPFANLAQGFNETVKVHASKV